MSDVTAHSVIQALPQPTLVIGAADAIEVANQPARDLLGEQIVGRHYVTALRQPPLIAAIEEAQSTGEKQLANFSSSDGPAQTRFDVHIVPVEDRLVLTLIDISDAQELDRFRRDFVANVSHELRTPLASLIGFIDTLRGPAKDDTAARSRFLEIMAREAQRMSTLVDGLLSLSRVEVGARKRPTTPVVLADLVATAISELDPIIKAAGASVSVENQSGACKVLADDGQLRQVIGNLLENALRYGEEQGHVAITISAPAYEARLRQNCLRLSVRDTGAGIAPHHLPRLTERFYRVDSHRSHEDGGSGLGLAIAKHIIHRHRGHLLIDSVVGQGSTFTVILPICEES